MANKKFTRPESEEVYLELGRMVATGRDGVLVTVLGTNSSTPRHAGSKMIVHGEGHLTGTIGGGQAEALIIAEADLVLADRQCRRLNLDLAGGVGVCGGAMEVFMEPVLRSYPFLVIGAGHLGRAVAQLASSLPFALTIVDDRQEFLDDLSDLSDLSDLGGLKTLCCSAAELAERLEVQATAGALVATRSHELDREFLAALLAVEARQKRKFVYLGVLGSKAKVARLRQNSDHPDRLQEIQMPVGLDLGAETPAEIALSILAEALAVLRGVVPLCAENGNVIGLPLKRGGDSLP